MPNLSFLRTSDPNEWAGRVGASGALPTWVERLIKVGAKTYGSINFPKEKFTHLPGVDGELLACAEIRTGFEQFIPLGDSVWELSVESGASSKALRDGRKRSQEELNHEEKTFVFMTPRSLTPASVKKITEEVSEAAKWKGVKIIHGPLFYDFMCLCPAIALEFACEIHGVASAGIMTLADAWQQLSKETNPELTEELAIITRSKDADELLRRISDNSRATHVAVQGDSEYESLAFIFAALRKDTTIDAANRCLVVETYSKAKEACKLPPSIFVIQNADAHGTRSLSVDNGHHVILSMGDQLSAGSETIELERPFIWDFATALSKSGKTEDEAERDARECGGSLTIFHRRFPAIHALPPKWRDSDDAKILLPLVLIGRWDGDNDHDRRDLEYLTGMNWPDIQTKLRNLIHGVDAPLLTAGSIWTFRSHIDGFEVLGRSLADEHFKRFTDIVRRVFSPLPKMEDKPVDEMMFSKPQGYSEQFKDGVAQALLLLAVRGEKHLQRCQLTFPQRAGDVAPKTYNATPNEYVEILMKELTALGNYRQLHQCIQEQLHILIEAAPDPLLETLEQALEGKAEGIRDLLQEKKGLFGLSYSSSRLIGALRVLAWDALHLQRISLILARLAELENEIEREAKSQTRRSERALGALAQILLWWLPQTFATLQERNAVLDCVISSYPDIGWELLMLLRPGSMQTSAIGLRPRLRDYAPKIREVITNRVAYEGAQAVVEKLFEQASEELARWISLIKHISNFSPEHREQALEKLNLLAKHGSESDKNILWEEMRSEIARHRTYADAGWALPEEELKNWDSLLKKLTPSDPIALEKWLFDDWFPDVDSGGTVEERQETIRTRRINAVKKIMARDGIEGIIAFAETVAHPGFVAESLEDIVVDTDSCAFLIDTAIVKGHTFYSFVATTSELARRQLANSGRDQRRYLLDRIDTAQKNGANTEAISMLLMAWPRERATWSMVESADADVEREYWRRVHIPLQLVGDDVNYVVDHMLNAGKASAIIDAVAYMGLKVDCKAILRLLDGFIAQLANETGRFNSSHGLPEFLKKAAQRSDVDESELADRELLLLPLLGGVHGIRLKIYQILARDPKMFVDAISTIYIKKSETKRATPPDEATKALATRNYELLLSWTHTLQGAGPPHAHENPGPYPFPGYNPDGTIDEAKLIHWVSTARKMAAEQDRIDVADSQIGRILAYAPTDPDDQAWPHIAVRKAIEQNYSDQLASGIINEQFSKRGVFTKAMFEGGVQEKNLSDIAKQWADVTARNWPKTSSILLKISKMWKRESNRANEEAEVRKLDGL